MDGLACRTCGETNPDEARLCGMCGAPLREDEAAGEVHRDVTLVTSDLKGSTALGERLDPEALREVLNRYFDVMRAVFESHGGTIEKIIGDAIVAVFGLPFRHEDDPLRAVEAAAESQRALATLNDELQQGWGVQLVNRTGVATGGVTFGRAEGGQHVLLGEPVDLSTVMEQNAPPQEVLLSASTYAEVADLVEVEAIPPVSAKGSEETFTAFRLISVHDRAGEVEAIVPEAAPGMRICPSCGEQSPERMRLCVVCGTSLSATVVRESRRTVTIVFAMPKVHSLTDDVPGPATMRDVMSRYFEGMRSALERHGGTVEKFIGDAVMAVFGLPVRHEDDAVRAIRAAADMQSALEALNPGFRAESGLELSNHIGVNSGEVIAGDASTAQRMVTGDAVNTAARLEQAAAGGEVVLGELTYRLARDQIEVEFMPPLTLKGKAEPVPAYRLTRVSTQATMERSHGTPFVGREAEMARLSGALGEAISSKGARLVTIVGDAGVGKSRLIREFATAASEQARLVRGRCLPYGDGITFWPLAEVVRDAAGITSEDSPRVATRRIDRLLERAAAPDRETVLERVAAAINLSAAQFPVAELMWGGRRLLETLAAQRPLVMLVDDLHWAEPTFLDFLDYLLETVEGASVLVLGSARHEIAERHADWVTGHEPMLVSLSPLSESDAGRIVEELLGSLDATVRRRIAEAAEGNPLYVEQIVSMLVETGAIERGPDGWIARQGTDRLQIPPTVQALVASRLDALRAEERAVVDPASVIGLTFALDAIVELVDEPIRPELGHDLDVLVSKQLVRRLPDDEVNYRFGHQIIRDTAYGSLLKRARAAIHERFVTWAERINRERGRELEFEEILGYHLEQAYRYRSEIGVINDAARQVAWRASEKLGSAGRRALDRSDLAAAAGLLSRAAALHEGPSLERVGLRTELSEAHLAAGNLDEAREAARRAIVDATEVGDQRLVMMANVADWVIDVFRSEAPPEVTLERSDQAIALFESQGDLANLARAWRLRSWQHNTMGHADDAAEDSLRAAEAGRHAGDSRIANRAAMGYASNAVNGSRPVREGLEVCRDLLAQVSGDRRAEGVILGAIAQLEGMSGNVADARDLYRRARELLLELGPSALAFATSIDSFRVEVLAGDLPAAEALLQRDREDLARIGETYFRSTVVARLAAVVAMEGRFEEARGLADEARNLASNDDTEAQILWRVAASRSIEVPAEAVALGREAAALAGTTQAPMYQAEANEALGTALNRAGDAEGVEHLERALQLYEAKGDRLSAERLRASLSATVA